MVLKLNGLKVDCIIGERDYEREKEQTLSLNIELEVLERACETDELSDTVDYAALAERVRAVLVAAKCKMIERAASLVAAECMKDRGIVKVRVEVVKPGSIDFLDSASVIFECLSA
jgi:dihydroneopterin aldolase